MEGGKEEGKERRKGEGTGGRRRRDEGRRKKTGKLNFIFLLIG